MGSLSAPVRPVSQPQIIYVPTSPTSASATASASAAATQEAATAAEQTAEEAAAAQRADNLLRRGRGRAGTIHTSTRGLLAAATPPDQRKTLLGE